MGNQIILDREFIFRLTQAKEEKDLIQLKKLHAHAQLISSIQVNAFRSLINLKILDISHNNLTYLDPLVFKPLINVEKIRIQNNNLTSIDPFIFKNLKKLRKIHLYWNRFDNDSLELFLEPNVKYVSFRSDGFIKNDIKLIVIWRLLFKLFLDSILIFCFARKNPHLDHYLYRISNRRLQLKK